MKALLLQVGLDKQSAGAYGPIFEDGSFEYIPKPAERESVDRVTYNKRLGRKRLPLAVYLPRTLKNAAIDDNPDFEAYRYNVDPPQRSFVSQIQRGDLIVFCAGLQPFHTDVYRIGLYIIGYFTAKDVLIINDLAQIDKQSRRKNDHTNGDSRGTADMTLIVGDYRHSALLDNAVPLANYVVKRDKGTGDTFTCPDDVIELVGLPGSISYGDPPIWITDQGRFNNLKRLLNLF